MPLRTIKELVTAGLVAESDRDGLERVVEKFALTLSDEVTASLREGGSGGAWAGE